LISPSRPGRRDVALGLGVLLAAALGVALRFAYLDRQVLGGDEYHLVQRVLALPPARLLSSYSPVDYNVPHAALTRTLSDLGLPVGERLLRAPVVLFGLLTLLVLPAWAARLWGRPVGWALLWCLAVSPWLVFFSRIVRSYGWVAFLGPATVLALVDGWRRGDGRRWLLAAPLGAAAVWSHLLTAPLVAGAFLTLGAAVALDRPRGARARRRDWLRAGGLAIGCALAALSPPIQSILRILGLRYAHASTSWSSWLHGGLHLAGSRHVVVALALAALVALGLRRAFARDRLEGWLIAAPVALQIVVLAALRPSGGGNPLVLSRYLVVALPLLLLAAALGVARLADRWNAAVPRAGAAGWALAPALALALFASGPLPGWLAPSRFLHARDVVDFVRGEAPAGHLRRVLAAPELDDARAIAVVPPGWSWSGLQDVVGAEPALGGRLRLFLPVAPDPRLRLRNSPAFSPRAVLASDAEALVVAKAAVVRRGVRGAAARRKLGELARIFGEPVVADRSYLAWDLAPARRRQAARERRRARLADE
jgi:hypothetical protein